MKRRDAILALLSLGVVPLASVAQQPGKVWRIGYLSLESGPSSRDEAFRQGLREQGYVVGRNVAIEYRWAGGNRERLTELAAELVRLKVDLILSTAAPVIEAAKRATRTIPIVMVAGGDPVRTGIVESLARPGGNISGLTLMATALGGKKLELARELLPKVDRVAVLTLAYSSGAKSLIEELRPAAQQMGIQLLIQVFDEAGNLPGVFSAIQHERTQVLIVQTNPIAHDRRAQLVELAAKQRLPAIYESAEFVDAGGLISYGPNVRDMYVRSAGYVDKILKGAKPADLPIEQPTKFEMVINLKTAKALGLAVPPTVLLRADRVIE